MMRQLSFLICASIAFLFSACDPPNPNVAFCGAEELEGEQYVNGDRVFEKGKTQDFEHAFEGEAACKLSSEHRYGMVHKMDWTKPGDRVVVSVWRYGSSDGLLIVDGNGLYLKGEKVLHQSGDWELLGVEFFVPEGDDPMSIFVWLPDAFNQPVWFDNLTIERLGEPEILSEEDVLRIELRESAMKQLEAKRQEALTAGVLVTNDEDWVEGEMVSGIEYYKIKMRLKGDWTDHLEGNKWSFRIRILGGERWNGIQEFSIQKPETRSNINEWVWHEVLDREGILSTRYDFHYVKLNNKVLGLYAVEEHFERELPESHGRKQGPLVKFNEDELWNARAAASDGKEPILPFFEAADIEVYGSDKKWMERAPETYEAAIVAAQRLQYSIGSASEVLDASLWGKHLAWLDISGALHSFHWINLRMYFNPESNLLEPVGFDGYSTDGAEWPGDRVFLGEKILANNHLSQYPPYLVWMLNDPQIAQTYVSTLRSAANNPNLAFAEDSLSARIEVLETWMKAEQPLFRHSRDLYRNRIAKIEARYDDLDAVIAAKIEELPVELPETGMLAKSLPVVENVSVRALQQGAMIMVQNFHNMPITPLGIGTPSEIQLPLGKARPIPAYLVRTQPAVQVHITKGALAAGSVLHFSVEGEKGVYHTPLVERLVLPNVMQ